MGGDLFRRFGGDSIGADRAEGRVWRVGVRVGRLERGGGEKRWDWGCGWGWGWGWSRLCFCLWGRMRDWRLPGAGVGEEHVSGGTAGRVHVGTGKCTDSRVEYIRVY